MARLVRIHCRPGYCGGIPSSAGCSASSAAAARSSEASRFLRYWATWSGTGASGSGSASAAWARSCEASRFSRNRAMCSGTKPPKASPKLPPPPPPLGESERSVPRPLDRRPIGDRSNPRPEGSSSETELSADSPLSELLERMRFKAAEPAIFAFVALVGDAAVINSTAVESSRTIWAGSAPASGWSSTQYDCARPQTVSLAEG